MQIFTCGECQSKRQRWLDKSNSEKGQAKPLGDLPETQGQAFPDLGADGLGDTPVESLGDGPGERTDHPRPELPFPAQLEGGSLAAEPRAQARAPDRLRVVSRAPARPLPAGLAAEPDRY